MSLQKKRVVHIAWLGHQNYGDDLMAAVVRRHLPPDSSWKVWCDQRPTFVGAQWIYPFKPNRFTKKFFERRALAHTDLLVLGGGSVLHSNGSIAWKAEGIEYFKKHNSRGRAVGIGLSVGPFEDSKAEKTCANLLASLNACALRDRASHDFARSLALPYDPALSFDLAGDYVFRDREQSEIKTVGLALRRPARKEQEERLRNEYSSLIYELTRRYHVVLYFFSPERDPIFLEDIVREQNVHTEIYDGDYEEFTKKIGASDFFISGRLHGLVVPYLLDIPVASIAHEGSAERKKFGDFCDYIGLPTHFQFSENDFSAGTVLAGMHSYLWGDRKEVVVRTQRNFEVFN